MARFSTGLRDALAVNYGLGVMMNGGVIRIYGGSLPDSPDNPPNASELGRITTEGLTFIPGDDTVGAGLLLSHLSPGTLIKNGDWRLKGIATGNAIWWRWCWAAPDSLDYSIVYPRVDGRVGVELILETQFITPSTNVAIEQFMFILPMGS